MQSRRENNEICHLHNLVLLYCQARFAVSQRHCFHSCVCPSGFVQARTINYNQSYQFMDEFQKKIGTIVLFSEFKRSAICKFHFHRSKVKIMQPHTFLWTTFQFFILNAHESVQYIHLLHFL